MDFMLVISFLVLGLQSVFKRKDTSEYIVFKLVAKKPIFTIFELKGDTPGCGNQNTNCQELGKLYCAQRLVFYV